VRSRIDRLKGQSWLFAKGVRNVNRGRVIIRALSLWHCLYLTARKTAAQGRIVPCAIPRRVVTRGSGIVACVACLMLLMVPIPYNNHTRKTAWFLLMMWTRQCCPPYSLWKGSRAARQLRSRHLQAYSLDKYSKKPLRWKLKRTLRSDVTGSTGPRSRVPVPLRKVFSKISTD